MFRQYAMWRRACRVILQTRKMAVYITEVYDIGLMADSIECHGKELTIGRLSTHIRWHSKGGEVDAASRGLISIYTDKYYPRIPRPLEPRPRLHRL